MTTLKASVARIPPAVFNRVVYQGERVRIARRTGENAYLVSEEDFALMEKLEDLHWAKKAEAALKEFEASGEKAVPLEATRAKLGL